MLSATSSARIEVRLEIGCERERGPARVEEPAIEAHTVACERSQIDVAAAVAAGHVVVGLRADAFFERMVVDREIVIAELIEPFDHIFSTIGPAPCAARSPRTGARAVRRGGGPRRSARPIARSRRRARRLPGRVCAFLYADECNCTTPSGMRSAIRGNVAT